MSLPETQMSIPEVPPSIQSDNISLTNKTTKRASAQLFLQNEKNFLNSMLTSSGLIGLAVAIPLLMPTPMMRWYAMACAMSAFILAIHGSFMYKRNYDAFSKNEQEFIDWNSSHIFFYCSAFILITLSITIAYELYWAAAADSSSVIPTEETPIVDTPKLDNIDTNETSSVTDSNISN